MSKPYEITGTVEHVGEVQAFKNDFTKRVLVVLLDGNPERPNYVPFDFTMDDCSKLDDVTNGQKVSVKFYVGGHKWDNPRDGTTKYFPDLKARDIEILGEAPSQPASQPVTTKEEDDLPW